MTTEDSELKKYSTKKLLSFPAKGNTNIENRNIFATNILLETILSDLERLENRIDLLENIFEAALGVVIEKNQK
jgi:hypothetical protein